MLEINEAFAENLNDWVCFAAVAEHGGFAAAGRALDTPKSRLSRRVALLEERLGVRLLQRTTRRFAVTETGQAFLRHCQAMLAEVQAGRALAQGQAAQPGGRVRLACPPALLQAGVGQMLARALKAWPLIELQVLAGNGAVDVWEGGVDLALRVRPAQAALPADEIVRTLAISPHVLVAAPQLLAHAAPPAVPQDVLALPTLGLGAQADEALWTLRPPEAGRGRGRSAEPVALAHRPRLQVNDMAALLCAALAGVGCAVLPRMLAHEALADGRLQQLLPDWHLPAWSVQAAFATRRGMRAAVRQVIDELAGGFEELIARGQCLPAGPTPHQPRPV